MSSVEEEEELIEFNVKFHSIEETLTAPFIDHFTGYTTRSEDDGSVKGGLVRSDPGGFVLSSEYARHAEKLYRFQPRQEDIWIATFPKCGTTWMQELLWLLVNDCNFAEAKKVPLPLRSPFLEMPYMVSPSQIHPIISQISLTLEDIESIPLSERRVIKSHLPFYLLNPKLIETSKVVYVARNPKDVMVSFYYHHKLVVKFHNFTGDFPLFARYFMDNMVVFGPYFAHVLDAWSKRHHPNLLFLFYEDLKKDLRGEIQKVAAFLGRSLSEDELAKLKEHLSFSNFAMNPMVNNEIPKQFGLLKEDGRFIRKGKTGDWKNHFSPELNEEVDRWIKNHLADSDLAFVDELEHQD